MVVGRLNWGKKGGNIDINAYGGKKGTGMGSLSSASPRLSGRGNGMGETIFWPSKHLSVPLTT